jgi:hypothetical protein
MSAPSNPINIRRWQNKVRSIFGFRGDNPIPSIAELLPVVVIENDRPEWGFGGNEFYSGIQRTQAGISTQFSHVAIVNPPSTGVLVVIEKVVSTVDANFYIASPSDLGAGPLFLVGTTASATVLERDLRIAAGGVFAARAETGSNAVIPWRGPVYPIGPAVEKFVELSFEISPGRAVIVATAALNTAITVGWAMRERAIERDPAS